MNQHGNSGIYELAITLHPELDTTLPTGNYPPTLEEMLHLESYVKLLK